MNRWPLRIAYFWESAPFFRVLLPFVAGIAAYGFSDVGNFFYLLLVTVLSLVLLAPLAWHRGSNMRVLFFVVMHTLLACGGYCLAHLHDTAQQPLFYARHMGNGATCRARITAPPAEKEHTWKISVEVINTVGDSSIRRTTGAGIVYLYKDELPMLYHKGDTIWLPANWQPVQNAGNPCEFDHARYLRRNNICYQQFCSGSQVRLYAAHDAADMLLTERLHNWCMLQLDKYITDKSTKGLIQAMLLGDEVNLDADTRQSYSDTGIVHVIAISGGNIMMFFTLISWLLWWIRNKKYAWVSYMVALPLVWFYVLMAGASPSAIRAAIMFSLLAGGMFMSKNNNSFNQLLATAFLLLCAQPMWLYAIGFQLSFVAVLSLIIFYAPIHKVVIGWYMPAGHKLIILLYKKLVGTICASLAAEILVAPVVVYYFHNFPVMFLIANVLAYVFMFVVLLAGILTVLLSWLPVVAGAIGYVTAYIVLVFNKLLLMLQVFNPQSFRFLLLSGLEMLLVYIAIAGLAILILRKIKAGIFIALTSLCVLLCLLCTDTYNSLQQQRFVVYNVGRANHIEVIAGSHYSILYTDTSAQKKIHYATQPAHIQWQAWRQQAAPADSVLYINGKRIVILNNPVYTTHFPADIVVVNYKAPVDPALLYSIFSPTHIVVGNNYTRKEQAEWQKAARQLNVSVHTITTMGAFVQ